ncbi:AAA family ATPase [Roseospira marina]|uniref:AAA family ATPase n=1 Tax=Roseospira marina TaxID=140057 RepID=A0A5M6IFI7_9PROT|nr:AAA family ATPase [Roseospira marina]KAA5606509.1 AAA family ATPase [Roseospira marina]MBB4314068.1 type II secretory pathway predicted ATPase ExeA [Roseospira marina]MBB5087229.1 type II secretory pathway predicted ATPase ExeA [Roseospira marina]
MYASYFGLQRKPFSLQPDASFIFLGRRHKLAFHLLQYGLLEETALTVITGEIGAGKTTLIQYVMENILDEVEVGVITHTHSNFGHIMRSIAGAFGIKSADADNHGLYEAFVAHIRDVYASGKRAVLVIDEAQNLSLDTLEEMRMLLNINTGEHFMLQIVLVGQPELLELLKRPELVQLVQRIGISHHLDRLDQQETLAYIRHRLRLAGATRDLFNDLACAAVHFFSSGTPRLINQLCDFSLVYAFSDDKESVTFETVCEVAETRIASGLSAYRPLPDDLTVDRLKQRLMAELYPPDRPADAPAAAPRGRASSG